MSGREYSTPSNKTPGLSARRPWPGSSQRSFHMQRLAHSETDPRHAKGVPHNGVTEEPVPNTPSGEKQCAGRYSILCRLEPRLESTNMSAVRGAARGSDLSPAARRPASGAFATPGIHLDPWRSTRPPRSGSGRTEGPPRAPRSCRDPRKRCALW